MHQRDPQHPGWLSVAHAHRASSLATGVRCCLVSGVLKAAASRPKELLAPAVLPGGVATPRRLLVGLMGIHRHADSPESSRIVREATQHPAKPGIVELRLRRATLGHALAKGHGVWFKTLDDTLGQGVDKALLPSTQPFPKAPALENTTGAVHSTGLLAVHPEAPAGQAPHPGRAWPVRASPADRSRAWGQRAAPWWSRRPTPPARREFAARRHRRWADRAWPCFFSSCALLALSPPL